MDIEHVRSRFIKHFDGTTGFIYASPGRINLIGEHTDYNGGFVFPGAIDKVRHLVRVGKHTWEVDVFHGANEGLVMAEIELASEDEPFEKPDWIGEEVSGDRRYYNSMLTKEPYSQWTKK